MVNQYNPNYYTLTYPTTTPPMAVRPGEIISYSVLLPGLAPSGSPPTTPPADNLTRITVTGTLTTDNGNGQAGSVSFRPMLVDSSHHVVFLGAPLVAGLNGAGAFSILLPATDDPETATPGFVYLVIEPSGLQYEIQVPVSSPGGTLDLSAAVRVGGGGGGGIGAAQATRIACALAAVFG